MSGKLLLQARKDASKITKSGGFEEDILLKTKDGSIQLAVKGSATGHTERFDNDGNAVNSFSSHITIIEQDLIDANYPYRGTTGKISLTGHQVTIKDNTQTLRNYTINEQAPNSTTGLIVCILGVK